VSKQTKKPTKVFKNTPYNYYAKKTRKKLEHYYYNSKLKLKLKHKTNIKKRKKKKYINEMEPNEI